MKHIKTYEKFVDASALEKGDYIIVNYNFMDSDIDDVIADEYSNQFNQFLNNNIGQIKEIKEDAAMTYYDITNAPAGAIFFFGNSDIIHLDFPHLEVLHRSKNKEDLKKYITANKYNL